MTSYTIRDPFLGKDVQISDDLTDRLCGKYACGPTLPNGEPEFGWRQHETPPIQHEASAEIKRLRSLLAKANDPTRDDTSSDLDIEPIDTDRPNPNNNGGIE